MHLHQARSHLVDRRLLKQKQRQKDRADHVSPCIPGEPEKRCFGTRNCTKRLFFPCAMSFIEMRDIGKSFGATVALDDANVHFEKGEVHALVGENGSGKSTLMRILAGVTPPDKG